MFHIRRKRHAALQRVLAEARQAHNEARISILKNKMGIIHGKKRLIWATDFKESW